MHISQAKAEFIQAWGSLGSSWGVPKSMAQVHALLLSSNEPMSTEEIMEAVSLSRGNVNVNVRELINWQLVKKQNKLGERKEFFEAHKDVWTIARNIAAERKRREVLPVLQFLRTMNEARITGGKQEVEEFKVLIKDLESLVSQLDQLSELMIKIGDNKMYKKMLGMLK